MFISTVCDVTCVSFVKVLSLKDTNAKLDIELEKVIEESLRKLREREAAAEENTRKTDALRAQLDTLKAQSKQELLTRDQAMEKLAAHLSHAHQRVRNMQDELARLSAELAAVQNDCVRYRDRAEKLERARRLGYLNESAPGKMDRSDVSKTRSNAKLPDISGRSTPRRNVVNGVKKQTVFS